MSAVIGILSLMHSQELAQWTLAIIVALVGIAVVIRLFGRSAVWRLLSLDREVAAVMHRTKSAEVRLGKIAETLAPLSEAFPVDVKKPGTTTVFIGQPVDFIHFDPDEGITFIEVKSGGAELSASQRTLRKLLEAGKVRWREVRIK